MTPAWTGTTSKDKLKRKPKPSYWRIVQLIRKLRLKYREHNRGENNFYITVDEFGIVFRFNPRQPMASYEGWDIVDVNLEEYEKNPLEFGRNLMWLLIAKGYMAYLRGPDGTSSLLSRRFLIDEGWAYRIIDKRLELYKDEARHRFMINLNKEMRKKPVHFILTYYPTFFDYLW